MSKTFDDVKNGLDKASTEAANSLANLDVDMALAGVSQVLAAIDEWSHARLALRLVSAHTEDEFLAAVAEPDLKELRSRAASIAEQAASIGHTLLRVKALADEQLHPTEPGEPVPMELPPATPGVVVDDLPPTTPAVHAVTGDLDGA